MGHSPAPGSWNALKALLQKLPSESIQVALSNQLVNPPSGEVYQFLLRVSDAALAHAKASSLEPAPPAWPDIRRIPESEGG